MNPAVGSLCFVAAAVTLGIPAAGRAEGRLDVYRVATESMEPTLACAGAPGCTRLEADSVVVRRLTRTQELRRGDIVVFQPTSRRRSACARSPLSIKRVVAVPGEVVSQARGVVYVDGRRLSEPYVRDGRAGRDFRPLRVPAEGYFLLGDNRGRSCDSRAYGAVPRSDISGRVARVDRT